MYKIALNLTRLPRYTHLMSDQLIGAAVIIFNATQRAVLLGKRKNSYFAGTYGLPGGRVEPNESLIDGAARELREETGLEAQKLVYIGTVREKQGSVSFIHFIFSCDQYSGQLQLMEPDKCEGWEWVSVDALPDDVLPGHEAGLELYFDPDKPRLSDLL